MEVTENVSPQKKIHYSCTPLKAIIKDIVSPALKEADRTKIDMEGNLKNLQKKIEDYERDHTQISAQIQVR